MEINSLRKLDIINISIILIVLILFVFLQPNIKSTVFGNTSIVKEFIEDSKSNGKINTRKFWETREFYSLGSFEFNKEGFPLSRLPKSFQNILKPTETNVPFLIFTSQQVESFEILTTMDKLNSSNLLAGIPKEQIILNTTSDIIYKSSDTTYVVFLRPLSEMEQTNGFLDYKEHDKKLLQDKNWLVISAIK